jgi:hypothetical protein
MILLTLILALMAVAGIAATARIVRTDGLRRVPTRREDALAGSAARDAYDPAT